MMHKFITIVCLAFFAENVYSAVSLLPPQPCPEDVECESGCYEPEFKTVIGFGDSYSPLDGSCSKYICQTDKFIQIVSCGKVETNSPNCNVAQDLKKPYPECCEKIQCKED